MPAAASPQADALVSPIRQASRQLVREWGFMRPTLADTALSATAVHCLIEVGDHGVATVAELRQVLRVDKAEARRAVQELVASEQLSAPWAATSQTLALTPKGRETLAGVNAYAATQVQRALGVVPPDIAAMIVGGLQSYAEALGSLRSEGEEETDGSGVRIVSGYRPGILGRTLEMHLAYYSRVAGWGSSFETSLAVDMAGLVGRLDRPPNEAWSAVQTLPGGAEERIVGTIFIDGEIPGQPGVAHLRCFIVDERVRGLGVGRRLLDVAMAFVRQTGVGQVVLWTMAGLLAACRLYEQAGFEMVLETEVAKWGQTAVLRQYSWRPGA